MKKYIIVSFILLFSLTAYALEDNLYEKFEKCDSVKFSLGKLANLTDKALDTKDLARILENGLISRKTIKFNSVTDKTRADIIINTEITRFIYSETDPIDNIMGSGAIAWDLINKDNYVAMEAIFDILDAKSGKVLWSNKVTATITKKVIPEEEAPKLGFERVTKNFIIKAFGKPKRR